jgi:hypothetical protein
MTHQPPSRPTKPTYKPSTCHRRQLAQIEHRQFMCPMSGVTTECQARDCHLLYITQCSMHQLSHNAKEVWVQQCKSCCLITGNHTLKRTPGISPTACPRRPNPAMRTSSCSMPELSWHWHNLGKAQDTSLMDERHHKASHD